MKEVGEGGREEGNKKERRKGGHEGGECEALGWRQAVFHVRVLLSFQQPTFQTHTQNINDLSAAHVDM